MDQDQDFLSPEIIFVISRISDLQDWWILGLRNPSISAMAEGTSGATRSAQTGFDLCYPQSDGGKCQEIIQGEATILRYFKRLSQ